MRGIVVHLIRRLPQKVAFSASEATHARYFIMNWRVNSRPAAHARTRLHARATIHWLAFRYSTIPMGVCTTGYRRAIRLFALPTATAVVQIQREVVLHGLCRRDSMVRR